MIPNPAPNLVSLYESLLLTSPRLELSAIPTSKPKKIRAPGTKKYASARKSNLLSKERLAPLSAAAAANIPAGEIASLRPPSQSLSPESSEEEYTSSEDESEYSDEEEEEVGDMRTLDEVRTLLFVGGGGGER